MNEPITDS